jgi:hypothetical protein
MKFTSAIRSYFVFDCIVVLGLVVWAGQSAAQGTVFRCKGNEYVASVKDSKNGDCKLLEGGNVTVVQGTRPNSNASAAPVKVASASPPSSSNGSSRNDSAEQKTRDSDSRSILESELKKSENKLAELLKEYNSGEPDRGALDIKMPQRYIERVAEMKASIARLSSDIEGIKRELGRNQGSTSSNTARIN